MRAGERSSVSQGSIVIVSLNGVDHFFIIGGEGVIARRGSMERMRKLFCIIYLVVDDDSC